MGGPVLGPLGLNPICCRGPGAGMSRSGRFFSLQETVCQGARFLSWERRPPTCLSRAQGRPCARSSAPRRRTPASSPAAPMTTAPKASDAAPGAPAAAPACSPSWVTVTPVPHARPCLVEGGTIHTPSQWPAPQPPKLHQAVTPPTCWPSHGAPLRVPSLRARLPSRVPHSGVGAPTGTQQQGGPLGPEGLARVSAAPLQKAGRCPRVPVPLAPEPCSESTECSVDSQCAGSRKCCFSTCAMRCLDPATGERPRPAPRTQPLAPGAAGQTKAAQRPGWQDLGRPPEQGLCLGHLILQGDLARELGNCFLATCDPTFLPVSSGEG